MVSRASARPSAEPSASASGSRWHTVSTRRASRSLRTTSGGTAARSAAVSAHEPARLRSSLSSPARDGAPAPARGRARRLDRLAHRRRRGKRLARHRPVGTAALLQLVEDAQHAVPRSAVSSSLTCSFGMRLRRSWPSRRRTKGIARPSARSARCARPPPMTDTHTLAWRRSGVTSTSVIVTKPIRGSSTSRRMTSLISSRSSSSTRAVRWLTGCRS